MNKTKKFFTEINNLTPEHFTSKEQFLENHTNMKHTNGKEPITLNGSRRPGQWEWHNENCEIQDKGIHWCSGKPSRDIWCVTHGQWATEVPVSVTYKFADGTEVTKERK